MYFVFIYLICLRDKISYKNIIKLLRVGLFFCDNFGIIFILVLLLVVTTVDIILILLLFLKAHFSNIGLCNF